MARDASLDIAKGILITLMMIGHMEIPYLLREIIYSFHMPAFILFSGYCFKPKACENLKTSIVNLIKTFWIPYGIWAALYLIMKDEGLVYQLKNIVYGMSDTNKLFVDRASVGQVYFLLLLFLVRFIYLFIYKYVKKDWLKTTVVILISLWGLQLGEQGYWLPWSLDCALYALIFYHIGYLLKRHEAVSFLCEKKYILGILMIVWIVMIYAGGMELYPRQYGNYVLTIAGAVSGSIFLYLFCRFISNHLPAVLIRTMVDVGKNTLSILLVHTIFGGYIAIFVVTIFRMIGQGECLSLIYIIVILLQIICGILWGRIYEKICKSLF